MRTSAEVMGFGLAWLPSPLLKFTIVILNGSKTVHEIQAKKSSDKVTDQLRREADRFIALTTIRKVGREAAKITYGDSKLQFHFNQGNGSFAKFHNNQ